MLPDPPLPPSLATQRWDDFRFIVAIARNGSLKRAAAALNSNVSTVSRRLDAIEERLGQRLFDRSPEGTTATAAAESLLPFAEAMEAAANGAYRSIEGLEREIEGEVRITAPPGLVDRFFSPFIAKLRRAHPRLRIQVLSQVGYADLARREADIALRAQRPTSGDLIARRLRVPEGPGAAHLPTDKDAPIATVLVGAPSLVASLGPLDSFEGVPFVGYGDALDHLPTNQWIYAQAGPEALVLRSNSMTLQQAAIEDGVGLGLLPLPHTFGASLVAPKLTKSFRSQLPPLPGGELWLVGHRALKDVPRIRTTMDALQNHIESLTPE